MKAIGRNLIIKKIKEGTTKTKGGLLLAENQRSDIRYVFYDRHAGHTIEINKKSYSVIKAQDVVVVT
jgi:co-chaperonin GroES (HSP10)